jgi:flavin reductase (DIM6/NTAB) family NADH-FMN oxidoreductase RutF
MSLSGVTPDHDVMAVTPAGFRKALGCFATGVAVITVEIDGQVHGMTANAFTSVSLDPPLVLVCVKRQSRTHECLHATQRFGANILTDKQRPVSEHFALPCGVRSAEIKYAGLFFRSERGTPVLEGSLAFLECRVDEMHVAGDHTIFLARVEEIMTGGGDPLLYFRGTYRCVGRIDEENGGERL